MSQSAGLQEIDRVLRCFQEYLFMIGETEQEWIEWPLFLSFHAFTHRCQRVSGQVFDQSTSSVFRIIRFIAFLAGCCYQQNAGEQVNE